jgi:hypothetical protein
MKIFQGITLQVSTCLSSDSIGELAEIWCGTKRPICQVLDAYKIPYPKDIVIYE